MAYPKFRELVNDTITQMGLVSGSAVQTYTEPLVMLAVNRIFNFLWNKQKWSHLWAWETHALDGATGKISGTLPNVKRWEDIDEVRMANRETPIPFPSANEHTNMLVGGADPMFRTVLPWNDADSQTKFFKFWPVTATGSVDLLVGHRPDKFARDDDVVPMDYDLMIDGSVWWMLADDGMNPGSAAKAQQAFDLTYQDLNARQGARGFGHGAGYRNGSTVIIRA